MASRKLNELALKASKGELTVEDINDIVLAVADSENAQDGDMKDLKKKMAQHDRSFRDIEEEYPLLPPEADDLSNLVKKKGVACMGGKKSAAYANTDLRKRIFMDIYGEVKRQYGLINETGRQLSYKKLKRKYFKGAMEVVDNYEMPIALANEVEAENELDELE